MTPKEAINIILRSVVHSVKSRENLSEALFIMQKAMERQIPKKANITIKGTTDFNTTLNCPTCHKMPIGVKPRYCSECGQAIDWSDGERKDNG
jgi:hypothetical protein